MSKIVRSFSLSKSSLEFLQDRAGEFGSASKVLDKIIQDEAVRELEKEIMLKGEQDDEES